MRESNACNSVSIENDFVVWAETEYKVPESKKIIFFRGICNRFEYSGFSYQSVNWICEVCEAQLIFANMKRSTLAAVAGTKEERNVRKKKKELNETFFFIWSKEEKIPDR